MKNGNYKIVKCVILFEEARKTGKVGSALFKVMNMLETINNER